MENLGLVVTVWSHSHGLDVSMRALVLKTLLLVVIAKFVERFLLKEV